MYIRQPFLLDLLHFCEFTAMVIALLKLKSLKNTHWKWFAFYLTYIFLYEVISTHLTLDLNISIRKYFAMVQIPIEFIFFYWLFALKSLHNKKLFWSMCALYLLSLFIEYNLTATLFTFKSLNNTIGSLLLFILVVLEFIKQIKSDSILNFKEDKMFYINIGVMLFYVGNMPFFGWYLRILEFPEIWSQYYIYFLVSNCIMYLLFAASFIWGKPK